MSSVIEARVRYFGVAAYEIIIRNGQRILLDPCFNQNPVSRVNAASFDKVDLIIVTHAAMDHLGDTAEIARNTDADIICGGEVKAYLLASGIPAERIRVTAWGMRLKVAGIEVQTLECRHCSYFNLPDGSFASGIPLAFILDLHENIRLYHPGDTAIFSDMKLHGQLYRPTVGSVGIANPIGMGGPGAGQKLTSDMSPLEGVLAAQWLGLKTVLPCHYTNPDDPLVDEFIRHLSAAQSRGEAVPDALVLRPAEWIEIDSSGGVRRSHHT
ncbi:MBL fold metallo-hydrolase [Mesorhizobium sp. M5C.F.Ca.IN.020.32.2.1]|uniref:MBL fold metallo-hydrolase n=1 Tax=Mesorhizobium sp. M5C.F.Ca.IN.020.32.2.1 TaxID=2496771 RepID=UPI000FD4AFFF|nr:MBL fold metallo-hydrolase [Mesorhizobium sp. M5C.F.Ca.IN.020.32.2.1]RUV26472.1 MBL fold metallo-hydrolase [Mesorhizobium sp. M5C.F.Ca.IN.020.32.2.1]